MCSLIYRQLPFVWKLEQGIECVIKNTGQSCGDYLQQLPAQNSNTCNIVIEYIYTVANIGQTCEAINEVIATSDVNVKKTLGVSEWNFCPGDTIKVRDERYVNLCNMAGDEFGFELSLNGVDGVPGGGYLALPAVPAAPLP